MSLPDSLRINDRRSGRRWHLPSLIVLWALIFLPALGGPEYKGEEPRRVQPALAMLGSGEWIVPQIGGEPYFNKPPLINWLVAFAFRVGGQSEGAARAVSAVAVFAMMLVIYLSGRVWMGGDRALFAALAAATHVSLIDKGRLVEIEPLYIALFSISLALWLRALFCPLVNGFRQGFALWVVPWVFLGLGVLAKGPMHLLFFYAAAVPVALAAGRARALLGWAHLGGIGAGLAVVLAWGIPFFFQAAGDQAIKTWRGQMGSRIAGEPDRLASFEFALNLPKGLGNFLPWTLLLIGALAVAWAQSRQCSSPGSGVNRDLEAARKGLLLGFLPLLVLLGLIPGILPRYTMPLFTPAALWLACSLPAAGGWPARYWEIGNRIFGILALVGAAIGFLFAVGPGGWLYCAAALASAVFCLVGFRSGERLDQLATRTVFAIAAAVLVYAAAAVPRMAERDDVRPVAREILRRVGGEGVLWLVDPESRPFIAYLPPSVRFAPRFSAVGADATHVIIKVEDFNELEAAEKVMIEERWEFRDRGRERFILGRLKKALPAERAD